MTPYYASNQNPAVFPTPQYSRPNQFPVLTSPQQIPVTNQQPVNYQVQPMNPSLAYSFPQYQNMPPNQGPQYFNGPPVNVQPYAQEQSSEFNNTNQYSRDANYVSPNYKGNRPKTQYQGKSTPSNICHRCKQPGHWVKDCPLLNPNLPSAVLASASLRIPACGVKGSENHIIRRSYIDLTINGVSYSCLLDTGCDQTVVPEKFTRGMRLESSNKKLFAVNGTKIPVKGIVSLPIRILGMELRATALVSTDVKEIMLGIDWMSQHNILWNFTSGQVMIYGQHITLHAHSERLTCCRLVLQTNIEIPEATDNVHLCAEQPISVNTSLDSDLNSSDECLPIIKGCSHDHLTCASTFNINTPFINDDFYFETHRVYDSRNHSSFDNIVSEMNFIYDDSGVNTIIDKNPQTNEVIENIIDLNKNKLSNLKNVVHNCAAISSGHIDKLKLCAGHTPHSWLDKSVPVETTVSAVNNDIRVPSNTSRNSARENETECEIGEMRQHSLLTEADQEITELSVIEEMFEDIDFDKPPAHPRPRRHEGLTARYLL